MSVDILVFYFVAILSVLITGISKSGFGGGLGVLSVPTMALVMPPTQAAGILLPILILMDMFSIYAYRKTWDRALIRLLLPAAIVGIVIGALLFKYLAEAHVRILVGLIAAVFTLNFFLRPALDQPKKPGKAAGRFWASVAGFTSFGVHAGGPPINVYLLPLGLDRKIFVGTMVVFFTIVNLIKVVPYAVIGQLRPENLKIALTLFPFAPIGVWMGLKLIDNINQVLFYRICYSLLFLTGIKLLYDGFTTL